jgi:hypothetical protein
MLSTVLVGLKRSVGSPAHPVQPIHDDQHRACPYERKQRDKHPVSLR